MNTHLYTTARRHLILLLRHSGPTHNPSGKCEDLFTFLIYVVRRSAVYYLCGVKWWSCYVVSESPSSCRYKTWDISWQYDRVHEEWGFPKWLYTTTIVYIWGIYKKRKKKVTTLQCMFTCNHELTNVHQTTHHPTSSARQVVVWRSTNVDTYCKWALHPTVFVKKTAFEFKHN